MNFSTHSQIKIKQKHCSATQPQRGNTEQSSFWGDFGVLPGQQQGEVCCVAHWLKDCTLACDKLVSWGYILLAGLFFFFFFNLAEFVCVGCQQSWEQSLLFFTLCSPQSYTQNNTSQSTGCRQWISCSISYWTITNQPLTRSSIAIRRKQ